MPNPTPGRRQRVKAWSRYTQLRVVGAGAFGQVYLVRKNRNATPEVEESPSSSPKSPTSRPKKSVGGVAMAADDVFVLKRLFLQGSDDVLQSAAVEVRVLESLPPHDNVVGFQEQFIDDEGYLNIVIECCPDGDLEKLIAKRKELNIPFSLREVLFFSFQILAAVRHFHHHGIMHRDLKPANILLSSFDENVRLKAVNELMVNSGITQDGGGNSTADGKDIPVGLNTPERYLSTAPNNATADCCIKIADFGIAKVLQETHGQASTVIGTPHYISPEICNNEPYTNSADMWAVGCIIYELAANGEKLFGGNSMLAVVQKICKAEIPPVPGRPDMDAIVLPLVRAMCVLEGDKDAVKRISAADAIAEFYCPKRGDDDFADDFEDPDEFQFQ